MVFFPLILLFSAWLFVRPGLAQAQTVIPFTTNGYLDGLSVNMPTEFNSGGFIDVNGYHIRIPDNLLVAFPARFIPFTQLFEGGAPKRFLSESRYQVNVYGNIVNGKPIAGIVELGQVLGQISNGIIKSIDYTDGSIQIQDGPKIRVNDPKGKYGKAYADLPEFSADDQNPSITAFSGFPMCIPRVAPPEIDPLCPHTNRPSRGASTPMAPDPAVMAPFMEGDYLEFSGVKLANGDIVCYSIVANVDIHTRTGEPSYIRMEDALVGVVKRDNIVEFAGSRVRLPASIQLTKRRPLASSPYLHGKQFIGFSSYPDAVVQIYAIDVDPCTGAEMERLIVLEGKENAADNPRARFRFESKRQDIGKYTREYHIVLTSGQSTTRNNITTGQYRQPVTEWVFPELVAIGATPPELDFKDFNFLADGFGPDDDGNVFHQLSPWPGATAPVPSKVCPNKIQPLPPSPLNPNPTASATTPVVSVSPDVLARPGVKVTLTARNTSPQISDADIAYSWALSAGDVSAGTLTGALTSSLAFILPANNGNLTRTFNVSLTHVPSGTNATASVRVSSNSKAVDIITVEKFNWISSGGGTLTVAGKSNVVDGTAKNPKLHLVISGVSSTVDMTAGANGVFTYSARNTKRPSSIFITDDLGGVSSTVTGLFGKRDVFGRLQGKV